jgi:hypothetical protein
LSRRFNYLSSDRQRFDDRSGNDFSKKLRDPSCIGRSINDQSVEWNEQQAVVSPELLTAGLIMNFLTEGQPMALREQVVMRKIFRSLRSDEGVRIHETITTMLYRST